VKRTISVGADGAVSIGIEAHYQCKGRWGSLHWDRSHTGKRVLINSCTSVPGRYI